MKIGQNPPTIGKTPHQHPDERHVENTKNASSKHGNLKNTNFEKLRFWSDFHFYKMHKQVFEANLFSFCKHEKRFKKRVYHFVNMKNA